MSIRIGIANYGMFSRFIETVEQELPEDVELVVLNDLFDELEPSVRKIESSRSVDVFVGSGGNADFLERYLKNIPLVRIKVTGFDLLHALQEAKRFSDYVGVITRTTQLPQLEQVRDVLDIRIEEAPYRQQDDVDAVLRGLYARGIRDVIGSAYVLERAELLGMRGHFIWSIDGVREGIWTAISLARNIKEAAEKAKKFNCILDYATEGIILTDRNGVITDFNTSAERILHRSRKAVIGKNCREVLPNTQLDTVMEKRQPQYNKIQDLGNVKIVTNRSPILYEDEVIGSLATFFSVGNIQRAETAIRQYGFREKKTANSFFYGLLGESPAFRKRKEQAEKYAGSEAPVLITGETGTGKRTFAQCIHNASQRGNERFVMVDCAAYSPSALERELFGYEEGAVSGGRKGGRSGAFELAHHGTLFLNQVGELPLKLQARVLRVLEEKEVLRLGGDRAVPVDIRVVAATDEGLAELAERGAFRRDLLYRLSVLSLDLPPLRERTEDIPAFVMRFLQENRSDLTRSELEEAAGLPMLRSHGWQGNLRELRNVLERFGILYQPGMDVEAAMADALGLPPECQSERKRIELALRAAGGSREEAAQALGISRTTLWRKLKEYHLS